MQINIMLSGGSPACGNLSKRWKVFKNQTHIGILRYSFKDQCISYLPESDILVTYHELVEVLRIMNSLREEEIKISIN